MSELNLESKFERFISNTFANVGQSFYDSYVEANVKFRSRVGSKTYIIRRQLGSCCKWCASLAGIYESSDAPDDIYRRHQNCKCLVTFKNEKGYTDVWSKKEFETQKEARQQRLKEIEDELSLKKKVIPATLQIENNAVYHNGKAIILRGTYENADFRIKILASHQKLAKKGWQSSEHFNKELLGRIQNGRIKSEDELFDVLNKKVNYIDLETHYYVKYYNGIGVIIDDINGSLVTVVPRKKPSKKWVKKL